MSAGTLSQFTRVYFRAMLQVGFFDFVALPLVRAFAAAFPGAQTVLDCFEANYHHWVELQQQQQQQQ